MNDARSAAARTPSFQGNSSAHMTALFINHDVGDPFAELNSSSALSYSPRSISCMKAGVAGSRLRSASIRRTDCTNWLAPYVAGLPWTVIFTGAARKRVLVRSNAVARSPC